MSKSSSESRGFPGTPTLRVGFFLFLGTPTLRVGSVPTTTTTYHSSMTTGAIALSALNTPRVDTRSAQRRDASPTSFDDLAREVDRIELCSTPDGSGLRVTGNWSAGQILEHLAKSIERSMDGFGALPLTPRAVQSQRARRAALLSGPMSPAGPSIALPGEIDPAEHVWTRDGAARLRVALSRIRDGHPMNRPSPTIGPLAPSDWASLHLRHAALHLSFIILGQSR